MNEILIITIKLILAIILGGLIGIEREYSHKPAGSRTFALVTLGSALLTILALQGFTDNPNVDPTRIIGQIVVGIGFIGAGLIIFEKHHIEGLTTASALWASAVIGITIGRGWYAVALIATFLILLLLYVVGRIEFAKTKKKTLWHLFDKR